MKLRDTRLPMMHTGGGQFGVRHVAPLDPGLIHALVTLEGRVHVASGGPMRPRQQRPGSLGRGGARTRFSPMREVRFWCFTSAVLLLSSEARRRDSARVVPVVYIPQVTTGAWSSWASRVLSGASMWTRPTSREITPLEYRFKRQTSKKVPGDPLAWEELCGDSSWLASRPDNLVQRPSPCHRG